MSDLAQVIERVRDARERMAGEDFTMWAELHVLLTDVEAALKAAALSRPSEGERNGQDEAEDRETEGSDGRGHRAHRSHRDAGATDAVSVKDNHHAARRARTGEYATLGEEEVALSRPEQPYIDAWNGLDAIMVEHGMPAKAQPAEAQAWLREKLAALSRQPSVDLVKAAERVLLFFKGLHHPACNYPGRKGSCNCGISNLEAALRSAQEERTREDEPHS